MVSNMVIARGKFLNELIVGSSSSIRFAYSRGKQVSSRDFCMGNLTKIEKNH